MATIMKKYFNSSDSKTEAILYVDSREDSSYISAVKLEMAKELKRMTNSIEKYGEVNLDGEIILKNKTMLNSVMDEYAIVESFGAMNFKLTLYKRIETKGWFWTTAEYIKICEIYYAECGRVVPLRKANVDPHKRFEDELSFAVKKFKKRAETGDVLEFYGSKSMK